MAGTECTGTAPERYILAALQNLSVECIHVTLVIKPESRKRRSPLGKISLRVTFQTDHSFPYT